MKDSITSTVYQFACSAQNKFYDAEAFISNSFQYVGLKCRAAADKTQAFISNHKDALFFCGCSAVTLCFTPELFIPVMIATIIVRSEITRQLRNHLNNSSFFKPTNHYGPHYVTPLALTLGTIAAIDALALSTIYFSNSFWVNTVPMALAAIAAGETLYRMSHDLANRYL